jgi:hypothetical protein
MSEDCVINVDLADVFRGPDRKGYLHTLAWGDYVEVIERAATYLRIATVKYVGDDKGSILPEKTEAYICPAKSSGLKPSDVVIPRAQSRVLKVNVVDVQQGDGAVIESPDGKVILVDGGDTQMFARYLAARYRETSVDAPKEFDCILVTHGDADHFAGLTAIWRSETNPEPRKQLFAAPRRVYHNGLVKRPTKAPNGVPIPDDKMLGATQVVHGETIITGLEQDLLEVPDAEMNEYFRDWKAALTAWNGRRPIEFRRLAFGDDDAFAFFNHDDLEIKVLGPLLVEKEGVRGLKFLGAPRKGPRIGHESLSLDPGDFSGHDVAHTINGHSIVFRLRYGGFSYLFCGDLNDEAGRTLASKCQAGDVALRAEVFKVPHHGSADFSGAFLELVEPLVSVISSGDESARKEYIHPRATLMGALGRHSRGDEPLIFVTELVAFFETKGWARPVDAAAGDGSHDFFAFSRTAYGIVKTRTDGARLLVYTDSGKADLKEAYCYALDASGAPTPAEVVRV